MPAQHCFRNRSVDKDPSIKPIPPKDYDGSPDPRLYHRFVRESNAYVRDGKVHQKRRVHVIAYHLEGKAYDFYMQKVADTEEDVKITDPACIL